MFPSLEISAKARFFVFLLCVRKISSFEGLEGRARAAVFEAWEEDDWARREESWDVNAAEVEKMGGSLVRFRPVVGRGTPYRGLFEGILDRRVVVVRKTVLYECSRGSWLWWLVVVPHADFGFNN